jgi:hypothetical protein
MRQGVIFSGRLSGLKLGFGCRWSVAYTGAPELPILTVTNPSPRKGREDVKGKCRAMEFGEEETDSEDKMPPKMPKRWIHRM